jgi:uncharacterized damage-inducible protein DinB
MSQAHRPAGNEHVAYYGRYIDLVGDGPIVETLRRQIEDTAALLAAVPADREEHRYQEGKWSVKEVVGHLCDAERVFAYRALRFAREDTTPLPGFDESTYVPAGRFGRRSLKSLAAEYRSVREATVRLFDGMDAAAFDRQGTASGNPVSVRALAWIIAGHERHHAAILMERYGLSA